MAHILVIDDERNVRESLSQALERTGHRVSLATNGNEGLAELQASRPDLVITDILMPEKEGMETIMEIHREWPEMRIIAISGGGRMSNMTFLDAAQKLGATMVLKKPFSVHELLEAVSQCLGEAA